MIQRTTKPAIRPAWPAKTQIIQPVGRGFSCTLWVAWGCKGHLRSATTLIRLRGCADWSASSLVAQVLLQVLPCAGSNDNSPANILLKFISDRYRLDRNPVRPITVQYRFKRNANREDVKTQCWRAWRAWYFITKLYSSYLKDIFNS